jgi:hypothetical protein
LTSHTGDIEISIPATATAAIKARSEKGQSDPSFTDNPGGSRAVQGNLLLGRGAVSESTFVARSFKGNIHIKRP